MKSLVIINEPFANMALGTNTTLAYILACVDLGHEVYVFNLKNQMPKKVAKVFDLTSEKKLCKELLTIHKNINQKIKSCVQEQDLPKLLRLDVKKVSEFLPESSSLKPLKLSDVDFVIQRLEPMKAPFPPVGRKNIDDALIDLKSIFPNKIFNCPIGLGDKDLPKEINKILKAKISTPTAEFEIAGSGFDVAVDLMLREYKNIYKSKEAKLVFKPNNSAQSLGVFSVEFSEEGLRLMEIKRQKTFDLRAIQNHKIKNNLDKKELKKIIEIICYAQNSKTNKVLKEIASAQIIKTAKALYNDKVLVQPFLEGVKMGDIRVNILKNSRGDFYVAGQAFRKSLRKTDDNFTTAFSTGGAVPQPVEILTQAENKNLSAKNEEILKILNKKLRKKYRDVIELGADFILVGDGANIFLGEVNHHCPGLLPLSEAMKKSKTSSGLSFASKAIEDAAIIRKSLS